MRSPIGVEFPPLPVYFAPKIKTPRKKHISRSKAALYNL